MDAISKELVKLGLDHIVKQPAVIAALAAFISNIDRLIRLALKVVSPAQLDAAIDAVDATAKQEVAKVAAEKP